MPELAARIRDARLRLGLTQEELARRLDVSFVTVNRWESGRSRPSPRVGHRLDVVLAAPPAAVRPSLRLPAYLTDFVGRHDELAELRALAPVSRLVTLTGPGGVGKSRLASAYAASAHPDVVLHLDLVALGEPSHLPADVVAALPMALLVLVDVGTSAAAQALSLIGELLAVPGVPLVMVTSRQPVGLPGELIRPVHPMTPADSDLLLRTRIAQRSPGWLQDPAHQQAIEALCSAAGGVPLALEMLAAWSASLSLDEIVERRAVILGQPTGALVEAAEAGRVLLDPAAQQSLQCLAVFEGGFTVGAAAALTGLDDDLGLVLCLRSLVDAGWLARDADLGTYLLAAPWRHWLRDRLPQAAADTLAERHGRHTLAFALEVSALLTGAAHAPWRARLEVAAPDIDAALHWAADHDEAELGLAAGSALWPWWLSSGRISEGRGWIDAFLARTTSTGEPLLARGWVAGSVLAAESGDHAVAIAYAAKASRVFGAHGQSDQVAIAEGVLGSANRYLGRRALARTHFERALALREELGDRRGVATSLNNLALLALDDGDLVRARRMLERSLAAKRALGEPRSVAIGLCNLAHTLLKLSLVADALTALHEAESVAEQLGDHQLAGTVACNLGDAHVAAGAYPQAKADFERAVRWYADHPHDQIVALCGIGRALDGLGRRDDALAVLRSAESLAERTGSEHRMNEVRETLAQLRGEPLSPPPDRLTRRQAEILACVAEGSSNREIAERLHLSVGTVERHLASAYAKLGMRNRVEATRYALQHGLLSPAKP